MLLFTLLILMKSQNLTKCMNFMTLVLLCFFIEIRFVCFLSFCFFFFFIIIIPNGPSSFFLNFFFFFFKTSLLIFFYQKNFFLYQHIMIDLGTGNNNKINWALEDKQEFIDIVETIYRGARKGRGLVISPKDYSTKYKY